MAVASVAEMTRSVDEQAAGEPGNEILSQAIEIAQRVQSGEGSTGSELADLVTVRSGIYLPDMARRYREAEKRIAEGVGQVALVIVNREVQELIPGTTKWSSSRGSGEALACKIADPELIIDAEQGTWSIPANEYFRLYPVGRSLEDEGPMPINDLLTHPAVPTLSSTLGQEFYSETRTRPSDNHALHPIAYRVLQETKLLIGDEIEGADIGTLSSRVLVPPVEAAVIEAQATV
jgi:hypothetical protein